MFVSFSNLLLAPFSCFLSIYLIDRADIGKISELSIRVEMPIFVLEFWISSDFSFSKITNICLQFGYMFWHFV